MLIINFVKSFPKDLLSNKGDLLAFSLSVFLVSDKYSIFFESFISLVSESTMETIFPTEKTYTPIYFKKPFLVWSVPNFHKALQELGFELYDEIIDYSFDSIVNDADRLEHIVKQIELLSKTNHKKMYNMVAKKAERNYNKMMNIRFNISLVPNSILRFGGYEDLVKDMI